MFSIPMSVSGGKPARSAPSGTIYFEFGIEDPLVTVNPLASMNADGSDKTLLPLDISSWAQPSYLLHEDIRWFLDFSPIAGEFLPDGSQRTRLEATSEDGLVTLPLFEDPSLWLGTYKWSKDDSFISFAAVEWDLAADPPELIGSALYIMPIAFDEAGPFADGAPFRVAADPETNSAGAALRRPVVGLHDWSPENDAMTYNRRGDIYVLDLISQQSRLLVSDASYPNWSPVGSKICFRVAEFDHRSRIQIQTIDAYDTDGTTRETIVESDLSLESPQWSPSGEHIAYILRVNEWRGNKFHQDQDLYVVGADGRGKTNLTDDIEEWPYSPSWR
jgi:hypothetical protein